jgi:pilus assembly protein Flp/PilA
VEVGPADHVSFNTQIEEGGIRSMLTEMNKILIRVRQIIDDEQGQDLVEYALLAGFVAVAAGALLPGISSSISIIFTRMGSVLNLAAS